MYNLGEFLQCAITDTTIEFNITINTAQIFAQKMERLEK